MATPRGQYLTFKLEREEYAIEILRIQEIRGHSRITPIPNTPAYVKGVVNLRGTVIPVVDLRCRLGMPETTYTRFTAIVVVTLATKVIGLLVDEVSDVVDIQPAAVQAPPEFGGQGDTRFIAGLAHAGERLIVLLSLDTILRDDPASPIPTPA
jgi:purine-binding chemotaxis protein CheW